MREMVKVGKQAVILIIFIAGICVSCILWMHKPGIHFMPGFMHVDVKESCYLYDSLKEDFFGETEVLIKGWGNNITKKFKGEISVAGYESEGEAPNPASIARVGNIWTIGYRGITGAMVKEKDGTEHWRAWPSDIGYLLWIDVRDNNNFVVGIADRDTPESYTFVIGADTKEKARQAYQSIVMEGVLGSGFTEMD